MGLLNRILGQERNQSKPYVDAGVALMFKLTTSLNLPGWKDGLPSYTPAEVEAINRRMSSFQKMANEVAGDVVSFHPDVFPVVERMLSAGALIDLAGAAWRFSGEVPADWRELASSYLKGWAANFNPQALMELGELLAIVGYRSEAKEAFRVLLLFPTYAETYFAREQVRNFVDSITDMIAPRSSAWIAGEQTIKMVDSIVISAKESLQELLLPVFRSFMKMRKENELRDSLEEREFKRLLVGEIGMAIIQASVNCRDAVGCNPPSALGVAWVGCNPPSALGVAWV